MSVDVHFQLEGFDEWVAWLRNCQSSELQKMNERIGRALVIQGFNNAARHTPSRTGRLKQSMNMGAPESYSKVKATAELVEATYGSNVHGLRRIRLYTERRAICTRLLVRG